MIVPLFKPYGESTHRLAQRYGKLIGESATHTGTLDPAAEGVVVILTGKDRFNKEKVATSRKAYVAEILFGINTDTHDLIGITPVKTVQNVELNTDTLSQVLAELTGTYKQQLPAFSAKRVGGKSYFDLAKNGKTFTPDYQEVTIHSIALLSTNNVDLKDVIRYQKSRLKLVKGNFRQNTIEENWAKLDKFEEKLPLIKLKITCSKRTYIRALVRDLSAKLRIPAVLYSLVRTENGPYTIKDCLCLIPSDEQ